MEQALYIPILMSMADTSIIKSELSIVIIMGVSVRGAL